MLAVHLIAGCASPGSGIQSGERVTVYVSMPLRGPDAADGRDVVDGARLALSDAGGKVGELSVRGVYLDDTTGRGKAARWSPAQAAANARRATEDSTAIAYLGDFESGATRFSLPVTNEAQLLQVSPAASAVDLVQPFLGAGDQVPDEVQPTGERTFGRVIPSDEVQGKAGAVWAKRLGAHAAVVQSDGSSFGEVMRDAFSEEAHALGVDASALPNFDLFAKPRPASPAVACPAHLIRVGGLIYSAGAQPPIGLLSPCAGSLHSRLGLMAPDSLLTSPALAALRRLGRPLRITSAAEDPSELPADGKRFVRGFAMRYGHQPGRYAAYGYEAMSVILDSVRRAGDSADERDSVVGAFFDTTDRRSILGTYSIDDVGNTTLDRLAGYRVVNGRPQFATPLRAP